MVYATHVYFEFVVLPCIFTQNVAILIFSSIVIFFFLCRWMEACLDEDLPPTTELEEGLRNGVYLGKLATFFAPKMVSAKRIYDRDQSRYKVKKKQKQQPWACLFHQLHNRK